MPTLVKGILFGLSAGAFWGLSFLIPKSYSDLTPGVLALARCGGFALISLVVLVRSRAMGLLFGEHWKTAVWLSMAGYSVYFYLLIFAIRFVGIPVSSLIIGLLPITISLASRESVRNKVLFVASLAAISLGILLLNVEGLSAITEAGGHRPRFLTGVVLSLVALGFWTAFSVQNSRYLKSHPKLHPAQWACALGVYSLLTIAPLVVVDLAFVYQAPDVNAALIQHVLIATVILGFGCSYVAGVLWNSASRILPTGLMGQLIVSETVFALLYGYLYDNAYPSGIETLSILLLIGGVMAGIRSFLQPR